MPFIFCFCFCFCFFGNTPPTCRCFPFCFLHGTPTRHREGVEACGGVQRSHVNGLGEFLPLFCVVIFVFSFFLIFMPMEVVREFETRHPFFFVNVYCFHFGVFLFFLTTRPWRLCPLLVCLFIQQCTRLLLMVLFLIHPRRTDVCFNVGCSKRCCCRTRRQYDTRYALTI